VSKDPYQQIIEPIARLLLGEPNAKLSSKRELRYGKHGSLAIDLEKGTFFDHELGAGGGALDLVTRETKLEGKERIGWLKQNGLLEDGVTRPNGHGKPHIVDTYTYHDEAGNVLFQVVRFEPKDFRQRRPDPTGPDGWRWSTKGVKQVPYRLPLIQEAIALERLVVIVEGEKDADRLIKMGIPATTNAGGAGKWSDELAKYFHGADVVIIPDHDPQKKNPKTGELMFHDDRRPILPGQDHARHIANSLDGIAFRVRVLDLGEFWQDVPPKGDISDWFDKTGAGVPEFYELVERVPDWSIDQTISAPGATPGPARITIINVRAWPDAEPEARPWIVKNQIPDRNVTLLSGDGGVGKTLLMQQLSVATVLAKDWIGEMPKRGPVLFITAEDDEHEMQQRYFKLARHYGVTFAELADAGLHLVTLAGRDATMAIADSRGVVKPTDLWNSTMKLAREINPIWMALDTAADIFVVNERDRSQSRQCISMLRGAALELPCAVILLAHPSLTGMSSGSGMSGSTAWSNSVRSRLYLSTPKKKKTDGDDELEDAGEDVRTDDVRILEAKKSNYSDLAPTKRLVWKNGVFVPEAVTAAISSIERAAMEAKAREVFLAILERYNRQNLTVSRKQRSPNYAPTEFAKQPEAQVLHAKIGPRKTMLREAMEHLFFKERIFIGQGPRNARPSRQSECIYAAGLLL
jgi:RecA-family ATPase